MIYKYYRDLSQEELLETIIQLQNIRNKLQEIDTFCKTKFDRDGPTEHFEFENLFKSTTPAITKIDEILADYKMAYLEAIHPELK